MYHLSFYPLNLCVTSLFVNPILPDRHHSGTHLDAGTGLADAAAVAGAGPAGASGMPSRPSSRIDPSQIRKNRHAHFGEQSQSSREIAGTDAIIRSAAISGANWRASSSMVQQSRRKRFTQTNVTRPGLIIEKLQRDPGSCW
jgi:hypothetical protein